MVERIKLWIKAKTLESYLRQSIINNVRERTESSELIYRYFRYNHNKLKTKLKKSGKQN